MSAPKILLSDAQLLKGPNFTAWKTKMRTILQFKDLWGIVSGKDAPPTYVDLLEKYEKADAKALMLITLSLSDEVQPYIQEATASSQAWSALCTIYKAKNLTTKLQL